MNMATTVSDAEFDRARAQVYDLLAAAFDGDMAVLRAALEEGTLRRLARTLPGDFEAARIEGEARLEGADLDEAALELGYDNLFAVPGPHFVPPFASAYHDEPSAEFKSDSPFHEVGSAGELYGDPARRMARLYERVGFDPDVGEGIPDHLGAQLSFMAALARRKASVSEDPEEDTSLETVSALERETLAHLGWVTSFADDVGETDRAEGVFASLAEFVATFVTWDAREHDIAEHAGAGDATTSEEEATQRPE